MRPLSKTESCVTLCGGCLPTPTFGLRRRAFLGRRSSAGTPQHAQAGPNIGGPQYRRIPCQPRVAQAGGTARFRPNMGQLWSTLGHVWPAVCQHRPNFAQVPTCVRQPLNISGPRVTFQDMWRAHFPFFLVASLSLLKRPLRGKSRTSWGNLHHLGATAVAAHLERSRPSLGRCLATKGLACPCDLSA